MRCHLPWAQTFINANGTVSPCCAPLELGNLAEQAVADVYTGQRYRKLQTDLTAGRSSSATRYCDNCYALRKFAESGYTFAKAYGLGDDAESALAELESSHPEFVSNYRLVREAYESGTALPSHARPLRLEVQLGEHCDIRCIMCWQDHARPQALRRETFTQIEELLPYALDVMFTGGEPTIYASFWRMVERFAEVANPRARLQLLTHGQHLRENLHRFEGVRNVGFCVNVDGPDRQSYEKIRAGSNWDKLNESLEAVAEARKTHPDWGLNMTFLLMRSNIGRVDETIAFADRYEAQWSCGMLAGEHTPMAQCRTFFDENVFRFSHLGYSTDDIVDLLTASLPQASRNGSLAKASLEATIQQVGATRQVQVPPDTAAELRAITDIRELSRRIRELVAEEVEETRPPLSALRAVLKDAETEHGRESPAYGEAALALGMREAEARDYKAAAAHLRAGLALCEGRDSHSEADLAEGWLCLGRCRAAKGSSDATAVLQEAWMRMKSAFGSGNSRTAEAALELGKALNRKGKHADAAPILEESHRTFVRIYGNSDSISYLAVAADELGTSYLELGRDDAARLLKKALSMYEVIGGPESRDAGETRRKLRRAARGPQRRTRVGAMLSRVSAKRALEFVAGSQVARRLRAALRHRS